MKQNERKEVVISLHPEWWERMKAGENEYQYKITLSDLGIKTPPQSWCYRKRGGAA